MSAEGWRHVIRGSMAGAFGRAHARSGAGKSTKSHSQTRVGVAMKRLVSALAVLVTAAGLTIAVGPTAARAESNGVGLTPALGWSSWSFVRHSPTTATIEAQADAM